MKFLTSESDNKMEQYLQKMFLWWKFWYAKLLELFNFNGFAP